MPGEAHLALRIIAVGIIAFVTAASAAAAFAEVEDIDLRETALSDGGGAQLGQSGRNSLYALSPDFRLQHFSDLGGFGDDQYQRLLGPPPAIADDGPIIPDAVSDFGAVDDGLQSDFQFELDYREGAATEERGIAGWWSSSRAWTAQVMFVRRRRVRESCADGLSSAAIRCAIDEDLASSGWIDPAAAPDQNTGVVQEAVPGGFEPEIPQNGALYVILGTGWTFLMEPAPGDCSSALCPEAMPVRTESEGQIADLGYPAASDKTVAVPLPISPLQDGSSASESLGSPVSEPSIPVMLFIGVSGLALWRRRMTGGYGRSHSA
jgi:hypothetical protein